MNKNQRTPLALFAAVAAGFLSMTGLSAAQSVLDQQLGATDSQKAVDANTPKPAPINPSAAKTIDDDDLVKQLTNPYAEPKTDPSAQLKEMLERMTDSQNRLTGKDPGDMTQESQRRILTDLDGVIAYVRKQNEKPQPKPKPSTQPAPKKQESKEGQGNGNKPGKPNGKPGNQAAQDDQLSAGNVDAPQSNGESLRNKGPSEWGNLPPKDRDLISNGVNEQYLPAYKDMIDRYYQALAEVGKTKENK